MIRRDNIITRETHVRDARLYIIVVEGEQTEHRYFEALETGKLIMRARVKPYVVPSRDGHSSVRHLVDNAEKAKAEVGTLSPRDEVWLVFDVESLSRNDSRERQVREALDIAWEQKWFVALSNPCFEVWLLLHLTDDLTNIDGAGRSTEEKLRDLLGGYKKSNVPQSCLNLDAIRNAIARAKARDTDPNSPIPALPGTRVYRLVERLVGARVV